MGTMAADKQVVFLAAARTPFGTFGGSLKDHSATELGILAGRASVERAGVDPSEYGQVFFGNVIQTSADAVYLARHVGLNAGLPIEVPAMTLNRLCGSGFQAVIDGAEDILYGGSRVCLTGGTESMSQAPHVVRGARWGLRLGPAVPFEDSLWEALTDTYCGFSMAQTAENLAEEYDISREEVDGYAVRSQTRAGAAWEEGKFDEEVIPVTLLKRGKETEFKRDEHMRPDTTVEALGALRPYFKKDGLVTAGNASGIGDGAAALVISDSEFAAAHGIKPMGSLVSWAVAGVPPRIMGIGPAPAARKALQKAGLALEDIDLIEVNEAFAPQYVAVERELGLDRDRVNVNGGAIALGHPIGCSGTRVLVTLIYALKQRGLKTGMASLCLGGGEAVALSIEMMR